MSDRYTAIAEGWLLRFNVTVYARSSGLYGHAKCHDGSRRIKVPWPANTRRRLHLLAHEIAHIALGHVGKNSRKAERLPRYVEEFECEWFAGELMREAGLVPPAKSVEIGREYVAQKIRQSNQSRSIDPDIARWARSPFGKQDRRDPRFYAAAKARVATALEVQ